MKELRGEERWAAEVIALATGGSVVQHDDGSAPAMFDLLMTRPDGSQGAVEVTGAADPRSIALWNELNGGPTLVVPSLAGGWLVSVHLDARAKILKKRIADLLGPLEKAGVRHVNYRDFWRDLPGKALAEDLRVAMAGQGGTDRPGSVYFTVDFGFERVAGFVAEHGDDLPRWLDDYLWRPGQEQNRSKLAASGLAERHLMLIVPGFGDTTFAVEEHLMRSDRPVLPHLAPRLPPEITHVWVMSAWTTPWGYFYGPEGWSALRKSVA